MLGRMNIRYVFCDAFDLMISNNIDHNIDNTHLINSDHYWGFKEKTLLDFLNSTNKENIWEDLIPWGESSGKHPSKYGYELIANELYSFITNKNILTYPLTNKFDLI